MVESCPFMRPFTSDNDNDDDDDDDDDGRDKILDGIRLGRGGRKKSPQNRGTAREETRTSTNPYATGQMSASNRLKDSRTII